MPIRRRIGEIHRIEHRDIIVWSFHSSEMYLTAWDGRHSSRFYRCGVPYEFAFYVMGEACTFFILLEKEFDVINQDFKVAFNDTTKKRFDLRFEQNPSTFGWAWRMSKEDFTNRLRRWSFRQVFKWSFSGKVTGTGADKVGEDLKGLYLSNDIDTDMVLIVKSCSGTLKFLAHSHIIKRRAENMPRKHPEPPGSPVIWETDCDPRFFEDFLFYLYSGSVMFTAGNVLGLYETARKCKVKDLLTQCMRFMVKEMSVDTFFDAVVLAFEDDLQPEEGFKFILKEAVTDYFAVNREAITLSEKWNVLERKNPTIKRKILQLNEDPNI